MAEPCAVVVDNVPVVAGEVLAVDGSLTLHACGNCQRECYGGWTALDGTKCCSAWCQTSHDARI